MSFWYARQLRFINDPTGQARWDQPANIILPFLPFRLLSAEQFYSITIPLYNTRNNRDRSCTAGYSQRGNPVLHPRSAFSVSKYYPGKSWHPLTQIHLIQPDLADFALFSQYIVCHIRAFFSDGIRCRLRRWDLFSVDIQFCAVFLKLSKIFFHLSPGKLLPGSHSFPVLHRHLPSAAYFTKRIRETL